MRARDSSEEPLGATCTPSGVTSIATIRWMGFCKVPLGPLTITEPPDTETSVFWGTGIGLLASRLIILYLCHSYAFVYWHLSTRFQIELLRRRVPCEPPLPT